LKRDEVLKQLEPLTNISVRTIEHQPRTKVVVQPDQVILRPGSGGRLMPINQEGAKSLANFIGMPQSLGKEITPGLFGQMATEVLSRRERYSVLLKNGAIIDFAKPSPARNISPERLVSTIEHAIPHAEFHKVTTQGYNASIEIVGVKQEAVRRGDLIRAGALVNFSPVGTVMPSVQSFVLRLACTNGMTHNDILNEYRGGGGGEGDDIWQWFRSSLRGAYGSLGGIVKRYRDMMKDHIPNEQRALILEEMLKRAKIGGEVANLVRSRAVQEPPRNSYEMLNLITWASSHLLTEPRQIGRAREVAATFASEETHHTYCPMCHTRH
jgi:hypothetical protein